MKKINSFLFLMIASTISLFAQANRPQEPTAPFPYQIEEVQFNNAIDGIELSGTLTIPSDVTDYPTAVLISGSGAQDRNAEIFGHKSFWVIADYFAKNGIAVLRVDDRGVGKSGGEHNKSSLTDFKNDTKAAVAFLKNKKGGNPSKIGLIGHSLGGVLAPMVASEDPSIAFIVLLAGTGIRGDKLMLLQKELVERKMGADEATIATGQKNIGGVYDIIIEQSSGIDSLKSKIGRHLKTSYGAALPESYVSALVGQLTYPWLMEFIIHDPAEALKSISCPVLAINGANDLQVPGEVNLTAIEKCLKSNGNNKVRTMLYPGLNHLFQESETGLPQEYGSIEQTFSLTVLKDIKDWILEIEQ